MLGGIQLISKHSSIESCRTRHGSDSYDSSCGQCNSINDQNNVSLPFLNIIKAEDDDRRPSLAELQVEDFEKRPSITIYQTVDSQHPDVITIQRLVERMKFEEWKDKSQ